MMRNPARIALAFVPLALALTLGGCGSGGDGDGVASANGGKKPSASGGPSMSRDEEVRLLAKCLREHGVQVPDPKPGEGIQMKNDGTNDARNQKAVEACNKKLPPRQNRAEQAAKERAEMLKHAKCMRANGVEGFKDPKPGEGVNVDEKIVADPDFKKASQICDKAMGNGGTKETQ